MSSFSFGNSKLELLRNYPYGGGLSVGENEVNLQRKVDMGNRDIIDNVIIPRQAYI